MNKSQNLLETFTVLTLNTAGLTVAHKNPLSRTKKIGEEILDKSYDIVCLQEVFGNNCRKALTEILKHEYPYIIEKSHYRPFGIPNWMEDSGLYFASKFEIKDYYFYPFKHITSYDSLAWKGLLGVTIKINNSTDVLVCTTHFQSRRDTKSVRHLEMQETQQFFNKHSFKNCIFLGDMNIKDTDTEYNTLLDPYLASPTFTDSFRFKHPDRKANPGYTFYGPDNDLIDSNFKARFDYIFTTMDEQIEDSEVVKFKDQHDHDLSDHYGVCTNFYIPNKDSITLTKIKKSGCDYWKRLFGTEYISPSYDSS